MLKIQVESELIASEQEEQPLQQEREVPDRLFKRHGRWRSENAKDGNVEDSLEERLRVSRSLGI